MFNLRFYFWLDPIKNRIQTQTRKYNTFFSLRFVPRQEYYEHGSPAVLGQFFSKPFIAYHILEISQPLSLFLMRVKNIFLYNTYLLIYNNQGVII